MTVSLIVNKPVICLLCYTFALILEKKKPLGQQFEQGIFYVNPDKEYLLDQHTAKQKQCGEFWDI